MNTQERGFAWLIGPGVDTFVCQSLRSPRSADRDERVPHRYISWPRTSEVELHNDGTGKDVWDGEAHVLDLSGANLAWVADFDDWLRTGAVFEEGAVAGDGGPCFAYDTRAGGNEEVRVNPVFAEREVGNLVLASGETKDGVECRGLVATVVA